jgi:hypothetical protein
MNENIWDFHQKYYKCGKHSNSEFKPSLIRQFINLQDNHQDNLKNNFCLQRGLKFYCAPYLGR